MELPRDERFLREEREYRLAWRCDDCGLYDARMGCAHGYPTERHRVETADPATVVFCKDFDLR